MKRHLSYLKAVLRHKYFVFMACMRLRVPIWIALLHDWDKFTPLMWFSYAKSFYNADGSKRKYDPANVSVEFMKAWKNHQQINKHHWQYWLKVNGHKIQETNLLVFDSGDLKAIFDRNSGSEIWSEVRNVPNSSGLYPLTADDMPGVFIREMLADWIGAGLAYGDPDVENWYNKNKDKMLLSPRTRMYLVVEMRNYLHKYPVK